MNTTIPLPFNKLDNVNCTHQGERIDFVNVNAAIETMVREPDSEYTSLEEIMLHLSVLISFALGLFQTTR